ncbi:3-phenylpropionate/cinnamic acid dioxygenase subunit beta [Micromonospora inositola]|uniref:3-phenylpropionate/cinnamic acid dioxygenase, small subunit n=1 Tax=Micromonospora inositola TaxID=47865 RepID=A0A1C5K5Z1_9ACTN|nr:3-phenylpropionate/cinnamic acid dioxygenase subunit beta [Micromonospora inositola]SCG78021.1 3-phenylpropionate/cinnamic acid dioxygenase, small subunit [Micromonospora inositola]
MDAERMRLLRQVEEWFYLEADLLDDRRFSEWLELLHDDLEYSMPLRRNVHSQDGSRDFTRPGQDILWFDEGKETLTKRVYQLQTGEHWAEEPVSRVSHLVTNIRLVDVTADVVEVSCRFLVYRNRMDVESDTLIGRRRDTLVRHGDGWLLRKRLILLDQSVLLAKNLTVFF